MNVIFYFYSIITITIRYHHATTYKTYHHYKSPLPSASISQPPSQTVLTTSHLYNQSSLPTTSTTWLHLTTIIFDQHHPTNSTASHHHQSPSHIHHLQPSTHNHRQLLAFRMWFIKEAIYATPCKINIISNILRI